jgi:hypothetical protein
MASAGTPRPSRVRFEMSGIEWFDFRREAPGWRSQLRRPRRPQQQRQLGRRIYGRCQMSGEPEPA